MRGQREVNLSRLALRELFHLIFAVLLNYCCSLTQEVRCCFLLPDALMHLEVEERRRTTAPSGPAEDTVRCISGTLLQIQPKQYHISPTQWHSLENKGKKERGRQSAEAKCTSIKGQIMNIRKMGLITRAKIWFEPVLMDFSLLLRKTASSAVIGSL